ncbi:hypothetical protein SAMN02910317_03097 [Ruminococcaceae bacterium FB2012]|nr:hypothetical protein SAMN02910317_03097 [Ruminococcaceae bacterium FB2012]
MTYALDDKVIQVQVLQSVVVDENFKPINDHFLNLLYQYHYNTDEVGYTLHITEISDPGDQTGKAEKYMYKQDRYADIKLDTELSLIEGTGRESRSDDDKPPLSEAEVKAMYEKYNDEITELRGKLYTLFGEENFKK